MTQIPDRLAHLDRDPRGYPIPWNVLRADDGTAFFTVNDTARNWLALARKLCPLCGLRLGSFMWFVGGPLSAFHAHGAYADLPGHRDCIEFALATCPFLAVREYTHRIDVPNPEKLPARARVLLDETQIATRPEVFVAVCCRWFERLDRGPDMLPHLRPRRPYTDWRCWRHGQRITDDEALPYLRAALGADWTPPGKIR